MNHTNRSMEDGGTECDLMNCGCVCVGLTQEVSEENINMWPRDCFCDINVAAFCPCPESLPKVKTF